jgi:hypothetical protein
MVKEKSRQTLSGKMNRELGICGILDFLRFVILMQVKGNPTGDRRWI